MFILGLGPIPAFGTAGAAMGTTLAGGILAIFAVGRLRSGRWVIGFPRGMWRPEWGTIRELFRFGLPAGLQGVAMNIGGVLLLRFIGSLGQSAEAQAAYAIGYTELFSLITWTSVGLMGATGAIVGQNLGAGQPDRADARGAAVDAARDSAWPRSWRSSFCTIPRGLLNVFGMTDPAVVAIAVQLLRFLSVSAFFITVALVYTGGLQGSGDTKSPFYISLVSQIVVPLGICAVLQAIGGT